MTKWILALTLVLSGSLVQANEMKIGFVNLQEALENTSAGKKALKDLEKELEAKKKELSKKDADIRKMKEDMDKKASLWTDEVRARRMSEFQQEVQKFQSEVESSELAFRKRQADLTQPILEKLERAIEKVAKEGNFTLVLNNTEAMKTILWGDGKVNLTDDVVKAFEKIK
jgi:outer membrane protein